MAVKATLGVVEFGQNTSDTFMLKLTIATHDANYYGAVEWFHYGVTGSMTGSQVEDAIKADIQDHMELNGVTFEEGDTIRFLHALALA